MVRSSPRSAAPARAAPRVSRAAPTATPSGANVSASKPHTRWPARRWLRTLGNNGGDSTGQCHRGVRWVGQTDGKALGARGRRNGAGFDVNGNRLQNLAGGERHGADVHGRVVISCGNGDIV